jgi:hypothetical protein
MIIMYRRIANLCLDCISVVKKIYGGEKTEKRGKHYINGLKSKWHVSMHEKYCSVRSLCHERKLWRCIPVGQTIMWACFGGDTSMNKCSCVTLNLKEM